MNTRPRHEHIPDAGDQTPLSVTLGGRSEVACMVDAREHAPGHTKTPALLLGTLTTTPLTGAQGGYTAGIRRGWRVWEGDPEGRDTCLNSCGILGDTAR